jgi:predicted  nucleic acid-binding Zn-ribbon protein
MTSRSELTNALTKPVNVLVPAGVVVAAALAGAVWLMVVAFVCWLALVTMTFRDEREARTPPHTDRMALAPPIAKRVSAAVAARAAIRTAIAESRSPLDDVTGEVEALVAAIEAHAVRAQRIHEFLADEGALAADPDALQRLRQRLDRLLAEMDQVVGALRTVQAEILASDGIEEAALASQVFDLRTRVQTTSEGLEEAFAETRAQV